VPHKRKGENRGLPTRWRHYHGAYYYRVPPGLEGLWGGRTQYRLGSTLGEAASEWAKHMASAALSLVPKRKSGSVLMLQAYIRVKMLIGIRRGDMLRLRMSDITDAGITVRPHKTANSTGLARTFEWTPALRAAVDMALAARPIDIAPWLFCTKRGEGYFDEDTGQATGWDSMWQRFMSRLLTETKISQRFTEHDLRGKVGSDAESLERARQLLGHADSKITERVYRRKPEIVRPLR
jgi:integrase